MSTTFAVPAVFQTNTTDSPVAKDAKRRIRALASLWDDVRIFDAAYSLGQIGIGFLDAKWANIVENFCDIFSGSRDIIFVRKCSRTQFIGECIRRTIPLADLAGLGGKIREDAINGVAIILADKGFDLFPD